MADSNKVKVVTDPLQGGNQLEKPIYPYWHL
jgi:hypothetical protein